MRTMVLAGLLSVGCGDRVVGPEDDSEATGPTSDTGGEFDTSWFMGVAFEGWFGLEVGEENTVVWYEFSEDGRVGRGSTFCEPEDDPTWFGTWASVSDTELVLTTDSGEWSGEPATKSVRVRRGEECGELVFLRYGGDGELLSELTHTRGVPCFTDCDGSGKREIKSCGEEHCSE